MRKECEVGDEWKGHGVCHGVPSVEAVRETSLRSDI